MLVDEVDDLGGEAGVRCGPARADRAVAHERRAGRRGRGGRHDRGEREEDEGNSMQGPLPELDRV
jgi:hypothetical protein